MVDPRSARLRSLPAVLPAIRRRGHSNAVASPFPWSNHRKLHPLYACRSHLYAAERPGSTAGSRPILALLITSLSGGETRHHACFVVRCQRQLRRAPLERFDCPAAPPTSCWSRESRQRSEIAAGLPTGHRVASRHSSASVSVQFPGQPASAPDPAPRLATRPVSIARCEALCSRGRSGFLLGLYPLKVRFAQRAF